MKDAGYGALLALQFLTRLPVPVVCPWTPATRRWAARSYPLVGLVIGVLLALLGMALRDAWPAPLVALALLSGWVALSGGLHLDGLMDLADALGCQSSGERRWA
ncbi:adenosylcobinamide-GDP ribazoletransferase, partial [Halomonas elongata]